MNESGVFIKIIEEEAPHFYSMDHKEIDELEKYLDLIAMGIMASPFVKVNNKYIALDSIEEITLKRVGE